MTDQNIIGTISEVVGSGESLIIRSSGERVVAEVGADVFIGDTVISPNTASVVISQHDAAVPLPTDVPVIPPIDKQLQQLINLSGPLEDSPLIPEDSTINTLSSTEETSLAMDVFSNDAEANSAMLHDISDRRAYSTVMNNGTLEVNLDGSITYTPNESINGTDSYTFRYNLGDFIVVNDDINSIGLDGKLTSVTQDLYAIIDDLTMHSYQQDLITDSAREVW